MRVSGETSVCCIWRVTGKEELSPLLTHRIVAVTVRSFLQCFSLAVSSLSSCNKWETEAEFNLFQH